MLSRRCCFGYGCSILPQKGTNYEELNLSNRHMLGVRVSKVFSIHDKPLFLFAWHGPANSTHHVPPIASTGISCEAQVNQMCVAWPRYDRGGARSPAEFDGLMNHFGGKSCTIYNACLLSGTWGTQGPEKWSLMSQACGDHPLADVLCRF